MNYIILIVFSISLMGCNSLSVQYYKPESMKGLTILKDHCRGNSGITNTIKGKVLDVGYSLSISPTSRNNLEIVQLEFSLRIPEGIKVNIARPLIKIEIDGVISEFDAESWQSWNYKDSTLKKYDVVNGLIGSNTITKDLFGKDVVVNSKYMLSTHINTNNSNKIFVFPPRLLVNKMRVVLPPLHFIKTEGFIMSPLNC